MIYMVTYNTIFIDYFVQWSMIIIDILMLRLASLASGSTGSKFEILEIFENTQTIWLSNLSNFTVTRIWKAQNFKLDNF